MITLGGVTLFKSQVSVFSNRKNAFTFCELGVKPLRVVLGDNDKFWVVSPRIANDMEKSGYQYA